MEIFGKIADFSSMRQKIIAVVLATDMTRHFGDIGKFKNRFLSNGEVKDDGDRLMMMEAMMHAADISNPTRSWEVCKK